MVKNIVIFCIALSASTFASAGICRPLDYQEIKEMKTLALRDKVYEYLNNHYRFTTFTPTSETKADQCEGEIDKMAGVLVKRKDYETIRRTMAFSLCVSSLCKEKYNAMIGSLPSR